MEGCLSEADTTDEHVSGEVLLTVVTEFIEEFKAQFGDHVHVLDWALHLDESTPHIHERHVFDCENKYGEIALQQEKALEEEAEYGNRQYLEKQDYILPVFRLRRELKRYFSATCIALWSCYYFVLLTW